MVVTGTIATFLRNSCTSALKKEATLSMAGGELANSCVMHHQIEAKVASSTLASLIA